MLATLPVAASEQNGFPLTNLLILLAVLVVLYPVQRKVRGALSRRRRERWTREDATDDARHEQQDRGLPPT